MAAEETVLTSGIFAELILPFLLLFTVFFAVLDKSKIFGEGKRQINAIVSLVLALIFVAFSYAKGIIVKLVPFTAVMIIIILIFMLLYGFVAGGKEKEGFVMPKGLKITFGIIIGISMIIAIMWATGTWDTIYNSIISGAGAGKIWANVLFAAIIIGAMVVVIASGGKSKS